MDSRSLTQVLIISTLTTVGILLLLGVSSILRFNVGVEKADETLVPPWGKEFSFNDGGMVKITQDLGCAFIARTKAAKDGPTEEHSSVSTSYPLSEGGSQTVRSDENRFDNSANVWCKDGTLHAAPLHIIVVPKQQN